MAGGVLGAAAGSAAFGHRAGEVADTGPSVVGRGQLVGQGNGLGRRIAEEVKHQRPAVEEQFGVEQQGGDAGGVEAALAVVDGRDAVALEAGGEQFVLDGDAADEGAVDFRGRFVLGRGQDLAEFQPARGADQDPGPATVPDGLGGHEPAEMAVKSETYEVHARHGAIRRSKAGWPPPDGAEFGAWDGFAQARRLTILAPAAIGHGWADATTRTLDLGRT